MLSHPIDCKAAKAKFFPNRFWGEICEANLIISGLLCEPLHKNIHTVLKHFGLFTNLVLKVGYILQMDCCNSFALPTAYWRTLTESLKS